MGSVDYFVPDTEVRDSAEVVAAYIEAYVPQDGLVIDPFCHSAVVARQAVTAGRRAIAVTFSPLDALRSRHTLMPRSPRELDAAVTRLADSPKLGVRLKEHLRRLYRTTCSRCGNMVIADYFIWERGRDVPKRVSYRCPACGDEATRDCDEDDAQVVRAVEPRGLHYWYVLDRVARREEESRKFAASLLELYTPRNLYVLSNLVMKAEDLLAASAVRDSVRMALLQCLEKGSKLNAVPGEQAAARQSRLQPPARFVEWNLWQLFEDAMQQLGQEQPVPPIALASTLREVCPAQDAPGEEQGRSSRAFVGHMSVRQLSQEVPPGSAHLVLAWPPELGRPRWAMPYLWTGWLYGHEEAALLWPVVRRRSSDWPWYLQAMQATLTNLHKLLAEDGHILFLAESKGLAYHEAMSLAGAAADLRLQSALYHPREPESATRPFSGLRGDYRLTWKRGPSAPTWPIPAAELPAQMRQAIVAAAKDALEQRAEPAPFVRLHCNILQALAQRGMLQRMLSANEHLSPLELLRESIRAGLESEAGRQLVQLWEDGPDGECMWWLRELPVAAPLSERVEQAARQTLEALDTVGTAEYMRRVYAQFPGALTPDAGWVMACLKSYGLELAPGRWRLREEDRPQRRTEAREALLLALAAAADRLGYQVSRGAEGFDLQWVTAEGDRLGFTALDSTAVSSLLGPLSQSSVSQGRRFAIFSSARQELLRLRLARSTSLRKQIAAQGWQFVSDADVQEWAENPQATLADLDSLVGIDALTAQDRTQLPLM